MAGNRPARERFEFSLDARQVAGVILGSLAALAIAFFLGHALGQRVADHAPVAARPAPAPAPADPLAVLDQAQRPDGGEPPAKLSYHDALTSPRPQEVLPPVPRTPPPAQRPAAPEAKPAEARVAAAPAATATAPAAAAPDATAPAAPPPPAVSAKAAEPAAPVAKPPEARPAVAAAPKASPAAKPPPAPKSPAASKASPTPPPRSGASVAKANWVVQVGSTQDRVEADRIAARFSTRGARVVVADVPGKGRWYRVRLGSFENREAADRYLRDLERTNGVKGFVAPAN